MGHIEERGCVTQGENHVLRSPFHRKPPPPFVSTLYNEMGRWFWTPNVKFFTRKILIIPKNP